MIKRIVSIAVLFSFFSACKKPSQPTPTNGLTTDVYVAGIINNGPPLSYACYWKNDKITNLGVTGVGSYASDITVVNNDVYVVGCSREAGNTVYKAALWKNGVLKFLTTTQGYVHSITVNNGIVYAVGEFIDANGSLEAFIWNSGTDVLTTIDQSVYSSTAYNIKYQSGEQLIVGYINSQATLWKNGVPSTITDPNFISGNATGIAANTGGYYFLGERTPHGTGFIEYGYWKQANGTTTFTNISNFTPLGIANQIAIKTDTLLLVGRTTNGWNAVLTKINTTNNTYSTISLLTTSSEAKDIFVDGNDIYVLIYDYSNNSATKVRYWKNGEIKTLETPTGFIHTEPNGIFVHKH